MRICVCANFIFFFYYFFSRRTAGSPCSLSLTHTRTNINTYTIKAGKKRKLTDQIFEENSMNIFQIQTMTKNNKAKKVFQTDEILDYTIYTSMRVYIFMFSRYSLEKKKVNRTLRNSFTD